MPPVTTSGNAIVAARRTPACRAGRLRPGENTRPQRRTGWLGTVTPASLCPRPNTHCSGLSGQPLQAGMVGLGTPCQSQVTRGHQLTLHVRASPLFLM